MSDKSLRLELSRCVNIFFADSVQQSCQFFRRFHPLCRMHLTAVKPPLQTTIVQSSLSNQNQTQQAC